MNLTPGPHKVHKYPPGSVSTPDSGSQITDKHKLKAFKGPKATRHAQIYSMAQTWAEDDKKTAKKDDKKAGAKKPAKKEEGKKPTKGKDDSNDKAVDELAKKLAEHKPASDNKNSSGKHAKDCKASEKFENQIDKVKPSADDDKKSDDKKDDDDNNNSS